MAIGPGPLGLVYFVGVKFSGYSLYAGLINSKKSLSNQLERVPSAVRGGLVRTGIGIIAGIVVGLGFWKFMPENKFTNTYGNYLFFAGLLPVRVGEWALFLWLLYRNCDLNSGIRAKFIFGGTAVSYLLDTIGILAVFVVPGGVWVC